MRSGKEMRLYPALIVLTAIGLFFCGAADALAAEGGGWRATYDVIMRWVNFAILAFVIVKFARRPLKNFLAGKGKEISLEIERLELSKDELLQKVRLTQDDLETRASRFDELKERIVQMGERRKQEIIEDARQESRMILESARHKIEGRIIRARERLKSDMIDAAAEMALEKLPAVIDESDNRKLNQQFLERVAVD